MTTWLPGWRRNNFKSSSGGDVVNLDLVLHIERLLIARAFGAPSMDQITTRDVTQEPEIGDVNFVWVKGHAGEDGNTMADRLASAGCAFPTPRETTVYGQEEILYLYGLRSAAKKKAKPAAKGAAEPTMSGYFKPPPVRKTATTTAAPSSSNAFARPNATASSSTASSSTPIASSSRPTLPAKRKQTEQRDEEVDELSDGGSDIVFVGSQVRLFRLAFICRCDSNAAPFPPLNRSDLGKRTMTASLRTSTPRGSSLSALRRRTPDLDDLDAPFVFPYQHETILMSPAFA